MDDFLSSLKGVTFLNIDPKLVSGKHFKTIFESEEADVFICKTIDDLKKAELSGRVSGYFKKVLSNDDITEIAQAD